MERKLRRLGEGSDEEQDAGGHKRAVVDRERVTSAREHVPVVERVHVPEDQERPDDHPHVADHVDHERLDARVGRGAPPVPERDQQVGGGADERPAHDEQDEVARHHQQEHREDEVVEVREVARVAPVRVHVRDRVDVDEERDAAHDERHEHRQRIDLDPQVHVDPGRVHVRVRVRHDRARAGSSLLKRRERADCAHERAEHRAAGEPAGAPPGQPAPAQPDQDRPPEGEEQDEPAPAARRHPRSSLTSSTSIGMRRRYIATMSPSPTTTSHAATTITISANT